MKKIENIFVTVLLLISLSACGSKDASKTSSQTKNPILNDVISTEEVTPEVTQPLETEAAKETLSPSTETETTTSDQAKSNNIKNSYTIDGITLSANSFSVEPFENVEGYTKRICVHFTFTNNTDKAFGYIESCDGYLRDGYKLEGWSDIMSMNLKQVPSNSSVEMTAYLLANDSLDLSQINVTYNFMDYNEEYWEDFGKIMSGEMGQEEYTKKYGNYEELNFEVTQE